MDWDRLLADCVDFTQRLIQTPSMPFEEAAIAKVIATEMQHLDFDEVWLDEIGNVCGRIHGQDRRLPALMLNCHLDHVDPGDLSLWSAPPYAAEIVDGRILGRGAADIKGPLAVQMYSMAGVLRDEERPKRDVVFTGVIQEEMGGAGAVHWVKNLDYEVALIVLGEPSKNEIALGHRDARQMWLTFYGRSVHASAPDKGENPNYALGEFLQHLSAAQDQLPPHPTLGKTTVAPTIIEVDTKSQNVTPAWTRVLLDFRTATESVNSLIAFVEELAADWPHDIQNALVTPPVPFVPSDELIFGYDTPPNSAVVQRAKALIEAGMGRETALTRYEFTTDGRHFSPAGIPIIGYSPAEEDQAHVANESISINKMGDALRGYGRLLRDF